MVAWANDQLQRANITSHLSDSGSFGEDGYLLLGAIFEQIKPGCLTDFTSLSQKASLSTSDANVINASLLLEKIAQQTAISVCTAAELASGDPNRILSLIWSLILFWQNPESSTALVSSAPSDSGLTKQALIVKQQLLKWCQEDLKEHFPTISVATFRTSFGDGKVIAALIQKRLPSICTRDDVLTCSSSTLTACLTAAQTQLGIPTLLSADELKNKPDEQALVALLTYFRRLASPTSKDSPPALETKRSSDIDSRLEQMRSRIRAKINEPGSPSSSPNVLVGAAAASSSSSSSASLTADSDQSRLLLERNQELEANIQQLQQQLQAVTTKAQEMERLARSVRTPSSAVDPAFDTTLAEIELALLEMIPEDQDTTRLDVQLDRLRQAVFQVCRKAEEKAVATPSPAPQAPSASASVSASSAKVRQPKISEGDDDDALEQLRTRLVDLEQFHYLHHCSWRELCVATLLPQ